MMVTQKYYADSTPAWSVTTCSVNNQDSLFRQIRVSVHWILTLVWQSTSYALWDRVGPKQKKTLRWSLSCCDLTEACGEKKMVLFNWCWKKKKKILPTASSCTYDIPLMRSQSHITALSLMCHLEIFSSSFFSFFPSTFSSLKFAVSSRWFH